MSTKRNYSGAAYTAILRALRAGNTFVPRDRFCGLTTVLAIGKRNHRGEIRRNVTARRAGNMQHVVCGVQLTKPGLRDMRADILANGDEIPAALTAALEPPAPVTAPYTYRSIIRDIDPLVVIGCTGRPDDIPF